MYKFKLLFALTLLMCLNSLAQQATEDYELYAVNDTVKNKKGEVLQEVTITGKLQKKPINVGKSEINPMDLPQASFVIGKETIEQQQIG